VAHEGTVFLDEVGEIPLAIQVKLLRVLQEREFERVGGTRPIKVDIRLIAATNADLETATKAKAFRPDFYYRLNVVSVTIPPLRERRDDIPLLAGYFVTKYAERCNRRLVGICAKARACLMNYEWPGNVRELENAIEHAVVLGSTDVILPEDLPEAVLEREPAPGAETGRGYHDAVQEAKKQVILRSLEQSGGSYTEAAKLLDIHPNYLHRLIRNLNLRPSLRK
jgi:Nif-specific regulatory protein